MPVRVLVKRLLKRLTEHNQVLGTIPGHKMEIRVKDLEPRVRIPYKVPVKSKKAFDDEITRLLELGIIRKSRSRYVSPAFSIMKKNGNVRLVVDYREIDKATIPDSFPFLDLYKEIRSIPRSSWFSQIDLAMGYHQIELEPSAQKYTAFVTPDGQYEYTRVPFALKNAPRVSNEL